MKIEALLPEKYVIICVRCVNALTPIEYLKALCQPFFERGLPINIGIVPNFNCSAQLPEGFAEQALVFFKYEKEGYLPIGCNHALINYLLQNHGCEVVQDGCNYDYGEFFSNDQPTIVQRIEEGKRHMIESGLGEAKAFLAPQDKLSSAAFIEIAKRFALISTNEYEGRHLPKKWLLHYAWKRMRKQHHWRIRNTLLLSHAVCRLSTGSSSQFLESIERMIASNQLSVINFHWWESSQQGKINPAFLAMLDRLADYIVKNGMIKVIVFSQLIDNRPLFETLC